MKAIPSTFLDGGEGLVKDQALLLPSGNYLSLPDILAAMVAAPLASTTLLAGLGVDDRAGIQMVGRVPYYWDPAATAVDTTLQLIVKPSTLGNTDPGRWVLAGNAFMLQLAATFATADGATLFTVPAHLGGMLITPRCYWNNTIAWSGGTASKIGISSSNAAYATDGDLQGGAAGDAAAAMGTGIKFGTVGAAFASAGVAVHLAPGDTILFQRMTSVYTAGAGKLIVPVVLL